MVAHDCTAGNSFFAQHQNIKWCSKIKDSLESINTNFSEVNARNTYPNNCVVLVTANTTETKN